MGKFFDKIKSFHKTFIEEQHMFFVGTSPLAADGRINISPKGMDSFRVIDEHRVGYMDVIGSGNETSAHTLENGRITFMFCSYTKVPLILRLYGKGKVILRSSDQWEVLAPHFHILESTRQLIIADIDMVQTSCGYGIPFYDYKGERANHYEWAEKLGPEGLEDYKMKKNAVSIDGLPTDISQSA